MNSSTGAFHRNVYLRLERNKNVKTEKAASLPNRLPVSRRREGSPDTLCRLRSCDAPSLSRAAKEILGIVSNYVEFEITP